MTMRSGSPPSGSQNRTSGPTPSGAGGRAGGAPIALRLFRPALAGLLGIAAALLVSCGSSGAGLIPVGSAGPLQGDFNAVAQAAENGNGSCLATEEAILKTERDFSALPSKVDRGLRDRLLEGITKLRTEALGLCKQPLPQATATGISPKTTTTTRTTPTTPTVTQTTTTPTTPTTTPTTSGPGGGTPAPGTGGGEAAPGAGSEQGGAGAGEGAGRAGGSGSGGAAPGASGQEVGK
jgi:hypothetical protein